MLLPAAEAHSEGRTILSFRDRGFLRSAISVAVILMVGSGVALTQSPPANPADPQQVIQFLSQTINWHRQLTVESQIAKDPGDAILVNDNRQIANQVVRLAFDFARADADVLAKQATSKDSQAQNPDLGRYQALTQLSAKLDNQARELQGELERLRQKLDAAGPGNRKSLQSAIAEVQSELDLTNVRRDALRSMAEFVSGTGANGVGPTGLRAQNQKPA